MFLSKMQRVHPQNDSNFFLFWVLAFRWVKFSFTHCSRELIYFIFVCTLRMFEKVNQRPNGYWSQFSSQGLKNYALLLEHMTEDCLDTLVFVRWIWYIMNENYEDYIARTSPRLTRSALPLMSLCGSAKLAMGRERGVKEGLGTSVNIRTL